jgi:hypothetical protein
MKNIITALFHKDIIMKEAHLMDAKREVKA